VAPTLVNFYTYVELNKDTVVGCPCGKDDVWIIADMVGIYFCHGIFWHVIIIYWGIFQLTWMEYNWNMPSSSCSHAHQIAILKGILAQNPISKIDRLVMYSSRLLNFAKKNYTTTNRNLSYGLCFTQIQTLLVK
jgi:hypothetical protein